MGNELAQYWARHDYTRRRYRVFCAMRNARRVEAMLWNETTHAEMVVPYCCIPIIDTIQTHFPGSYFPMRTAHVAASVLCDVCIKDCGACPVPHQHNTSFNPHRIAEKPQASRKPWAYFSAPFYFCVLLLPAHLRHTACLGTTSQRLPRPFRHALAMRPSGARGPQRTNNVDVGGNPKALGELCPSRPRGLLLGRQHDASQGADQGSKATLPSRSITHLTPRSPYAPTALSRNLRALRKVAPYPGLVCLFQQCPSRRIWHSSHCGIAVDCRSSQEA
jgi:hypothetical protein